MRVQRYRKFFIYASEKGKLSRILDKNEGKKHKKSDSAESGTAQKNHQFSVVFPLSDHTESITKRVGNNNKTAADAEPDTNITIGNITWSNYKMYRIRF